MNNQTRPKYTPKQRQMIIWLFFIPLFILVVSMGFSWNSSDSNFTELPITAKLKTKNQTIELEVANTLDQVTMGLRKRKQLPENRGMLFNLGYYTKPLVTLYEMKFSIDIIYISEGKVVAVQENLNPCGISITGCTLQAPKLSRQMIELNAGAIKKYGIKVGQTLEISQM